MADFSKELEEVYNSKPDLDSFRSCLHYFGIDATKFTNEELNSKELVQLNRIEDDLKISPLAYAGCKDNFDRNIESGLWTSMLDMLRQ